MNTITDTVRDTVASVATMMSDDKKVDDSPATLTGNWLTDSPTPPKEGEIVEGMVSAIGRARVYIDLHPFGSGLIYGREYMNARDILRKVSVGDTIAAKVVDAGNEDGYIELSLKEARQALIWADAEAAVKEQKVLSLEVKEANKGGLIIEWQVIQGF